MINKKPNNLYIKFLRNNIFLNVSNYDGKSLFKCSYGNIKSEQQKHSNWALIYLIKYFGVNTDLSKNRNINLIVSGAVNKAKISLIYVQLLNFKFIIGFLRVVDKTPHNGCRLKVKMGKLRKCRYLG
jgi:ribosomal protein S11